MLLMRRKSNFLDLKGTEHAHAMAFSRVNECMKNKRRAALELRRGDKLESRLSLDHLTHVEDNVISKFLRIFIFYLRGCCLASQTASRCQI